MSEVVAGHCGKCGAPYTSLYVWHGVGAAPMTPTCACWNLPKTYTSSSFKLYIDGVEYDPDDNSTHRQPTE